MKKAILITSILCLVLIITSSCNNGVNKTDFHNLEKELSECKKRVEEMESTPQGRLTKAEELISHGDFANAKIELNKLIDKFGNTSEGKKGQNLLSEIEKNEKMKKYAEERKRNLGYKALKETTEMTIDSVSLNFKKIGIGEKWTFDYDEYSRYISRPAERDNVFVLAKVYVTSKVKYSRIPLISVYKLVNGNLILLGNMKREFIKDDNGGQVDFKYVSTIGFSQALEISKITFENNAIFVVVKNDNCSKYEFGYYLDSNSSECNIKSKLTIDDFDKDYTLIKVLNKDKL